MSITKARARRTSPASLKHLVLSSGGSRAILGGAGSIVALEQAGIDSWDTLGGVSGGSIPAVLKAAKFPARRILRLIVDIDFASLLTRHASIPRVFGAYLMKGRYEKTRPRSGVFTSEKLGDYVDDLIHEWPKGYWTMAVAGENQILFNEFGVLEIGPDGTSKTISDKPAPLGVAIRASCSVPGILSAVPFKGRYLFDGALSLDGHCPVVIAKNVFHADTKNIVACDVGEDGSKASLRLIKLWKILFGKNCVPAQNRQQVTEDDVAILARPTLTAFPSLQFTLSSDQKWQAVMAGYISTFEELKKAGVLCAATRRKMRSIVAAFKRFDLISPISPEGHLSRMTEELLASNGLL